MPEIPTFEEFARKRTAPKRSGRGSVFSITNEGDVASWGLHQLPAIEQEFQRRTGKPLQYGRKGQGSGVGGWSHENNADVGYDPGTPEAQALEAILRERNIPFRATPLKGVHRNAQGKIISTDAHYHLGPPSGSRRGAAPPAPPVLPTGEIPTFEQFAKQRGVTEPIPEFEPTESVTSTIRDDVDFDAPLPPIEFKPFDASQLPFAARVAAGGARIGGANMAEVPEGSPNQGGQLIKATVKTDGKSYPNADQLANAVLESLGAKEIGAKYKAETGRNLLTPNIGLEELKQGYDPKTGTYSFEVQPTRADLAVINAYAKGGVKAAQAEIMRMRGEVRETDEKTAKGRETAREIVRGLGYDPDQVSEGNGPIAKGLGDAIIGTSRLINNLGGFVRDPRDSARDAQFIENASAAIPQERSSVGRVVRGVTGAIGSAPRYANPLAPVVAMAENVHRGKGEAIKSGLTMAVPSGVVKGSGAALNQAAPITRQAVARGLGGATNVITDKVTGSDKNAVESFVEGALLPVGKRKQVIRHADPRIDGGVVIGKAADGRLKVQNNEGGVSIVKNPRTQGNQLAAISKVRETQNAESVGEPANSVPAGRVRGNKVDKLGDTPMARVQPQPAQPKGAEPVVPIRTRERQTPKSLEAAGLPKGTDLTYDPITNRETLEKAQAAIKQKGVDRSISDLYQKKELTAEDTATGVELLRSLQAKGDIKRASEVADHLSQKLTEAGQAVQAASIIARLSPEGVLLTAQRRLREAQPGKKLAPEQAKVLQETATKVREAEAKVISLEKQIAELKMRPAKAPRAKLETLQERLAKAESEARARLAARIGVGKGGQTGASTIPLDIADYAIIGASKLAQKGITFAKWSQDMVAEFGEEIKPKLQAIYRESYRQYDTTKKDLRKASERRGILRGQPKDLPDAEVQKLIDQRAEARKNARTASAELARRFEDLTLTTGQKIKRTAGDVLNIPKTLKSSVDLSAPRQAAMWMATHPVQGARTFFGKQLKAMRGKNFDKYVDELMSDPDYPVMQRAGLELTTTPKSGALSAREEAFMSKIAGKLPGVKQSERAYTTFIDTARVSWFKQLKAQAEDAAGGKPVSTEQLKAIANFVNIGTGRGNLGKGALNNATPILNALFFAPKYAASKVQIFDPRVYARLPKGARKTAIRQAAQYFGTITATAVMLKYGFGLEVGLDPEESDFLKLKIGNTRYDLAFGQGQYVTLAARLARNTLNWTEGKDDEYGKTAWDNIGRFVRYKLAPIPAAVYSSAKSKDPVGQPTSVGKEAIGLVTPLFLNDLYEAFQEEGLAGVAKTGPAFVGVNVNTYERKEPKKKTWTAKN